MKSIKNIPLIELYYHPARIQKPVTSEWDSERNRASISGPRAVTGVSHFRPGHVTLQWNIGQPVKIESLQLPRRNLVDLNIR